MAISLIFPVFTKNFIPVTDCTPLKSQVPVKGKQFPSCAVFLPCPERVVLLEAKGSNIVKSNLTPTFSLSSSCSVVYSQTASPVFRLLTTVLLSEGVTRK